MRENAHHRLMINTIFYTTTIFLWLEMREDMSENHLSSAVGIIVPLAVTLFEASSSKAGLSASPLSRHGP